MKVLSDSILVRVSTGAEKVELVALESELRYPAVDIPEATIKSMNLDEFSKFLGERLILLSPSLREEFKDYFWSSDGSPPRKKPFESK